MTIHSIYSAETERLRDFSSRSRDDERLRTLPLPFLDGELDGVLSFRGDILALFLLLLLLRLLGERLSGERFFSGEWVRDFDRV